MGAGAAAGAKLAATRHFSRSFFARAERLPLLHGRMGAHASGMHPDCSMKLIYAFPEPLPLARARGIQTAHTVCELARLGVEVDLYHVPGRGHPIRHYGIEPPGALRPIRMSRSLPWPLVRVHSNRLFLSRLKRALRGESLRTPLMVRHLKLAAMLLQLQPELRL